MPLADMFPIEEKQKPRKFTEEESIRYRFHGERYSFCGSAHTGPSDQIPQFPGNYAYPREHDEFEK